MKFPKVKDLIDKFWSIPIIRQLLNWSKKRSLPGFFKVPIYDVVAFIINEVKRNALVIRANAMAYSFFLSIFPAIIVLFTLLPFLRVTLLSYLPGGDDFMEVMEKELKALMPGSAGDMLFETIEDITTQPRFGLLSFGFVLAMYFASNGMVTMMQTFEKSYRSTFRRRSGVRQRLVAIMLTSLIGLVLLASVLFIIVGQYLIDLLGMYFELDVITKYGLTVLRYFSMLALYYTCISLIYRYGAATHKRFNFFSPGATLASILSILSSLAFSYYVDSFNTYNKLYGSIGTIIVIILWIQLNAFVILLGFELNASIAVNRDLKLERKQEL